MARKQRRRIASRGSVNTIILKSLVNGDKYGYEIIKDVEKYSNGTIKLKQPSLYSSLSRFEDKGIVSSYWGDSDIGGRRHYYHLTENGVKYYQKEVLKIKDDFEDEDEKPNQNEDVVIKNQLDSTPTAIEIPSNDIPAIVDFTPKPEEVIIPDHNFYSKTPIDNKDIEVKEVIVDTTPWKELSDRVKISNSKIAKSKYKKLHYKAPMKSHVVILDKDGIYKLRDSDYKNNKETVTKSKIIDNVIKRHNVNYGYPYYTETQKQSPIKTELTEEEKRQRNENFLAKFNKITENKIAEKNLYCEPKPTPPQPKVEEERIDYRSKLDILTNQNYEENTDECLEENNIFNYVDDDSELEDNDNFIDLEPTEFDSKVTNTKYIEEINNYVSEEPVKIAKYESKNSYLTKDRSYVLINKVKFIFGIILTLLMIAETTISMVVFNNLGLIGDNDNIIFIFSYVITGILAMSYILPFIFNSSTRKLNTFKYKYSIALGILTFLICTVLIYCINALNGFQIDNFNYFAVKLILPMILSFNFVICPPIYGAIVNSKRFYD